MHVSRGLQSFLQLARRVTFESAEEFLLERLLRKKLEAINPDQLLDATCGGQVLERLIEGRMPFALRRRISDSGGIWRHDTASMQRQGEAEQRDVKLNGFHGLPAIIDTKRSMVFRMSVRLILGVESIPDGFRAGEFIRGGARAGALVSK